MGLYGSHESIFVRCIHVVQFLYWLRCWGIIMNWAGLGKKVADFAPLLGGVIGGPGGLAAGKLLAAKFGTAEEPAAIAAAIDADPAGALKLKETESNNRVQLEQMYLADRQNARLSNKDSKMPAVLSVGLTLLVVLIVYLLFFQPVPAGAKEVLFMLLGVVVKEWGGAMQYWFGTTRSSSEKTRLLTTRQ